MVPSGWNLSCLGKLGNWSGGGTPSKAVSEYWENGNIPWVSPKDMGVKIISNTEDYITQKAVENSATKVYPANSILVVTRSGILRKRVPVALAAVPVSVNQDIKVLAPSDKFCPQYVANFMWCFNDSILAKCAKDGTTVESIDTNSLTEFPIKLPPLPEQRKIAAILSTWDKAITTTEQLLANSQQQKKALMQQLLTGKKRLLDENGERFRGEWKVSLIRELASCITKGTTPSTNGFEFQDAGIPFIKVESIKENGTIERSKLAYIDNDCHQAFKRSQLRPGDILFSIAGALGRVALVPSCYSEANTNQAVCLIRLEEEKINKYFAYFILQSPKIKKEIIAETAQAAQPNLSLKNVGEFRIPVPTTEEQRKIASVLTSADQEIEALQHKLEVLKQEKKALMQQLLTGKRRVKIDEVAA